MSGAVKRTLRPSTRICCQCKSLSSRSTSSRASHTTTSLKPQYKACATLHNKASTNASRTLNASSSSSSSSSVSSSSSTSESSLPDTDLKTQRQRLKQLDYDLRHQVILNTTTDALKRSFRLKNYDDRWTDRRIARSKVFLDRSVRLEERLASLTKTKGTGDKKRIDDLNASSAEVRGSRKIFEQIAIGNIRDLIKSQIGACTSIEKLQKILVVALDRDVARRYVKQNQTQVYLALRRMWQHIRVQVQSDEREVRFLKCLNAIVGRLKRAGVPLYSHISELALMVAIRQGCWSVARLHLEDLRNTTRVSREAGIGLGLLNGFLEKVCHRSSLEHHEGMPGARLTKKHITHIIIGDEGSNERSKGENEDEEESVNLAMLMDQTRPEHVLCLLRLLHIHGTGEAIWAEWQKWQGQVPLGHQRKRRAKIAFPAKDDDEPQDKADVAWKSHRQLEIEFVKILAERKAYARAWAALKDSRVEFDELPIACQDGLLEKLEFASFMDEKIRQALLDKYAREMEKVEKAYGVKWVEGTNGGFHEREKREDDLI